MSQKKRIDPISVLLEIAIDLVLICMGALLYYHFLVYPLAPVDLSPIVVYLFGSKQLAVLAISGVPFIVGVFSLLRTPIRIMKKKAVPSQPN